MLKRINKHKIQALAEHVLHTMLQECILHSFLLVKLQYKIKTIINPLVSYLGMAH